VSDEHEEVTSPDQHRPTVTPRTARVGAILTFLVLAAMLATSMVQNSSQIGRTQDIWIIAGMATIVLLWVLDVVLRRNGLRR
jgi:hypothetical protein